MRIKRSQWPAAAACVVIALALNGCGVSDSPQSPLAQDRSGSRPTLPAGTAQPAPALLPPSGSPSTSSGTETALSIQMATAQQLSLTATAEPLPTAVLTADTVQPAPVGSPEPSAPPVLPPSGAPSTSLGTETALSIQMATAQQLLLTATAEPITTLADVPWVVVADRVFAAGTAAPLLDLRSAGQLASPDIRAAPDGTRIAFIEELEQQIQVVVLDVRTGQRMTIPIAGDRWPYGLLFAPDAQALAYTATYAERWELRLIDLRSGQERVVQQGVGKVVARALAWTSAGLMAERQLSDTDQPPSALLLIDPIDGSSRVLREGHLVDTRVSEAGDRVALVLGPVSLGGALNGALAIRHVSSGAEQTLIPALEIDYGSIRWSPNGRKLLYHTTDYATYAVTVTIMNIDGSDKQTMTFGTQEVPGKLKDAEWHNDGTVLVLLNGPDQDVQLYTLSLSAFDQAGMLELGTFEGDGREDAQQWDDIIYVPRCCRGEVR